MGIDDANKKKQFDKVIAILSKCFNVPIAYVSAIKSDAQEIHSSCGLNFKTSKRSTSFCGHSILQTEILVVEDALKDERFYDNPMVLEALKLDSMQVSAYNRSKFGHRRFVYCRS